ncbi:MAG: prephenate dehydrogenase/arogenate dehydrogenase family protein [Desulfobacterales bacterium]|nr:prephenate dehydrogenase/arogenate dehydrogenase family protein [Desulfobacterales bacterium]
MIGIIGFGRFGRLMAGYLARDLRVRVYDRRERVAEIEATGAHPASLAQACRQAIVIPCVPISTFRSVLTRIRPFLRQKALVADICSVKTYPVQWMREVLPPSVSILATHPMFGPDSAATSLEGRKIVVWPERMDERPYRRILHYLRSRGLIVLEATPQAHDRQIAVSLGLTHFIGRSLSEMGVSRLDVDTEGYQRLLHILGVVQHDTWQLFLDMHRYNPYAEETRNTFLRAMTTVNGRLDPASAEASD